MDSTTTSISNAELQVQSHAQAVHISKTNQAITNSMLIEDNLAVLQTIRQPDNTFLDPAVNNIKSSGPKLAGAGMTEFHKFVVMPYELRARIMEVNMFEDHIVSDPRIIRIHIEWNPEEDECFGNHGQGPAQPWDESCDENEDSDEDADRDQEAYEADHVHTHVYPDHENFSWKVDNDSEIRRSHRPLIPYFTVSKECKGIVEKFLAHHMGRCHRAFWSPELRSLPLSPWGDIFYIDCPAAWEAVNEWGSRLLRASHDALLMRKFMVSFTTFHGLVVPAMREKNHFLIEISNKEPVDYFRGESSMTAVFRNATCIHVVSDADRHFVTTYQKAAVWGEEGFQEEELCGLQIETKELLQSVWRGENNEFNGLRNRDGNLPRVFFVTIPGEVQAEGQKAEQENGQ